MQLFSAEATIFAHENMKKLPQKVVKNQYISSTV